jgi:hypothetical protein
MGRKLLLTLALATFGAAVAASAVDAGSSGLLASPVQAQALAVLPACSNSQDDDGDGLVDLADPGCSGSLDNDEYNAPPPACSNSKDDDGDGHVDLADPGCSGPQDNDEYNAPPPPPPPPPPDDGGGGGGGGGGGTGGGGGGGTGGGGGSTGRVPKEFFGLGTGGPLDFRDYQQMHEIKVRTIRVGLNWRLTEPKRGHFVWPDARVATLAENGIRPVFTVFGSPKWVSHSPHQGIPPLKGKARNEWRKFLTEAVRRYGPKGSFWRQNGDVPKKAVKSWQIWNEPNLVKYFPHEHGNHIRLAKSAPRDYAKLVKMSDQAITKAGGHAKVVLAGLTAEAKSTPGKKMASEVFLKKFLKVNKITKHFDAAALHPYEPNIKKFKKAIHQTRKVMRKGGAGRKQLWLTEVGWGSGSRNRFHLNKGKGGQAKLLKRSFKLTVENRKKWNIGRVLWFEWRDPPPGTPDVCSFCTSSGLLKFDRTHKPAYKKFKHFTKMQGKRRHRD